MKKAIAVAWVTCILLFGGANPAVAEAHAPRVVWTDITIASREKRPELEHFLKQIVETRTRRANWGKKRQTPIEARFEVTEFSAVLGKDVVRVTCTAVGKLKGGQSVRSHFSMGGRPAGRAELERQLLAMLGRGIVSRLAEVARTSSGG
jgi:hypothetical protein